MQAEAISYPDTLLLIDGAWRAASGGRRIPVSNPATEEIIGHVEHAEPADLDAALAAAAKGFAIWRGVSAFDRCAVMRKAAQLLRDRVQILATHLTMEQGKPLAEAKTEILSSADIIDWFAEEGRRAYGRIIPARAPHVRQMVIKDPVGPVVAFTPWNFPVSQLARKLAAALAAGCSIIVKAAEETPAAPAGLIRCFTDAGVPDGVIGLVYGDPAQISAHLIPHPVIRKVSFTGSTPVGKMLAALAGQHMKRVTMELGGHAPVLIARDADIGLAAGALAAFKARNAGQVCVSPTRFLVERPVYADFVDAFGAAVAKLKVGNGLGEGVQMGALANSRRIDAMEALVADATARGARLITGGNRIGNKGLFYEPTVLTELPLDARAMNDEPFGPMALVQPMASLDEMLAEANRLNYGLAAYAFTRSAATAGRMADEVQAGMLSINHFGLALPEVPFGGINDSGYGTEGGADALDAYLNARYVTHRQVD